MARFVLMVAATAFTFFTWRVFGDGTCRVLEFLEPQAGRRLKNHVIHSTSIDLGKQCQLQCYLSPKCLSYNLGTQEPGNKFLCELSDSDHHQHPKDLVYKESFWYNPTASLCGGISCPPAASCIPNEQGQLRCVCPANWTNIGNCERDIDECSTGSHECHVNATCTDTKGSYNCTCNDDVIGDGLLCIGFPFHWTLNGSDPFISLHGGSYQRVDGRKVLFLNGSYSYAETPAIPLQKVSFSILCWIKVLSLSDRHPIHIYSDWSEPFQFMLYISKANRMLCSAFKFRGASTNASTAFHPYRIHRCGSEIFINQWTHVALTWSRINRTARLYQNGTQTLIKKIKNLEQSIDLNPTGHTVYDIGLKRDHGKHETFHGYLRDLIVIDRAITSEEVEDIMIRSKA